jgi:hypothetical protein
MLRTPFEAAWGILSQKHPTHCLHSSMIQQYSTYFKMIQVSMEPIFWMSLFIGLKVTKEQLHNCPTDFLAIFSYQSSGS